MGCVTSNCADSERENSGLRLMTSKLHFRPEQLEKLNDYFGELARSDRDGTAELAQTEAKVERLVQRLVAGLGNLDRRFSVGFLVSLNEARRMKQRRFEYLLRLDALSSPSQNGDVELPLSLEEDTGVPGFARLRLRTGDAGPWTEFVAPDGRLRRDLLRAKIAALLAGALKPEVVDGVDERFCTTPGQVLDAEVLDKIVKQPQHCRVFYGPAGDTARLPEIGDCRVVIVENETGIILKIGLSESKCQDIEVRLLIGASMSTWPTCLDYPRRIPLHHCDALLHYAVAQTGTFVVAAGPHPGTRCEDKPSLWRMQFPAAETMMRQHYCDESVPALTESALLHILDQLKGSRPIDFCVKRKGRVRLVSRHMLRAICWWGLERCGPDPLRSWLPETLSQHVLRALDELLRSLKCQNLRCYFQPRCNLMLQCARGGCPQNEDAYAADARLLESYLHALHAYSVEWLMLPQRPTPRPTSSELLERELLDRWPQVLASLPRPVGTVGHFGYGPGQLQYLSLVIAEVLSAKDSLHQVGEQVESLIYLLQLVLKQAKDQAYVGCAGRRRKHGRRRSRAERKRSCARAYFDRSVDVLVDVVRRDRETAYSDLENGTVLARTLLKWLHFGAEEDQKVLGPLLRPYLGSLRNAAHEFAWHAESWRRRRESFAAEIRSLGLFCKLVVAREALPASGIVEALSRGWSWADGVARAIERSDKGLRLVFPTRERVLRYQLKFAGDKGPGSFSAWSKARDIGNAVRRASLARDSMISATDTLPCFANSQPEPPGAAGHVELRDTSPLTFVAAKARRRGRQRGPGGLIPALVSLNKFRVLQEAAQVLPAGERTAMLELVQKVARETARRTRRASCPDPSEEGMHRQLYTPRSESKMYEAPEKYSPKSQQQRIILERQLQLRQEISEIHDTLTRGLRSRSQLPTWDSTSVASWASPAASLSRGKLRRHHTFVWDAVRGPSPLWDSVSCSSTFARVKENDTARNNGILPKHHSSENVTNNNEKTGNLQSYKLPSWEFLDEALDKKFRTCQYVKLEPDEQNGNVDYLFVSNDTRELSKSSV